MAPATIAGAAPRARTSTRAGWDRDSIIIAIQEWVATYGEPPRAADWNPSSAKWSGQLWRVERYRAGRGDGSRWPALNSAKRPFGGSLTEAILAAGFEPAKPGPQRRKDVDPEQAHRADMSPEGRAMVAAALAQAREAERRVALLEAKLERAGDRALRLTAERDAARRAGQRAATPKVIRERVVDDAAVARAQRQAAAAAAKAESTARAARDQLADARMDTAEARTAAKRMAAKLERAEATIGSLRGERRELKAAEDRLSDRLVAAERMLDRARADAERARQASAERAPVVAPKREQAVGSAELRAARADAARDRRAAADAELRAAGAERELRETVAAIRGEARRLTAAELAELRMSGPSGPAAMAEALKALAAARRTNNPTRMQEALRRVAQAAVTWQERI
jgi:chromosome segregation ATPase